MAIISGIFFRKFPQSGQSIVQLAVHTPVENVDKEKFYQRGMGFSTDTPYGANPLSMNLNYFNKLEASGAFVPNQDYDFEFKNSPENPLVIEVVSITPTNPELKKQFLELMK